MKKQSNAALRSTLSFELALPSTKLVSTLLYDDTSLLFAYLHRKYIHLTVVCKNNLPKVTETSVDRN